MNTSILGRLGTLPTALLLAAALVSCTTLPPRQGSTVVEGAQASATLQTKNPSDIVIAPIIDETDGAVIPADELRRAFHSGLVKRRYSPLSLTYVDQNVTGDQFTPGTLEEDAVLAIYVEEWDTTYWSINDAITARIEVRILDSENGELMWQGQVDDRFDLENARSQFATDKALIREACRLIATEVLAAMPARRPAP